MKKMKRIFALIGVVFLLGLYGMTIICAIFDKSDSMVYLKASIVATVIIPTLLYGYMLIYRLVKKDTNENESTN